MKAIKTILAGAATALALSCCTTPEKAPESRFTLWQLPSMADDHGNSYVIRTANDSIIVIDGGKIAETNYLRGFLGAMGNRVTAWIFTHPHWDHMAAAQAILADRQGLEVGHIYHSRFTPEMLVPREGVESPAEALPWYATLDSIEALKAIPVTDMHTGDSLVIDGVKFRILSEKNPEISANLYNNSSMAMRVEDDSKSVVFLGDLGIEGGNKLLNSEYRKYLDCDYLQMAHHGQNGCDENFYKTINFRACLWPTPTWLWNNDIGNGPGSGPWATESTRRWMDEKGITEHYPAFEGLHRID